MLKYRLIFGPMMIAALVAIFYLDDRLDRVILTGTVWQDIFLGRTYLPAGLLLLAAFFVLIALGAGELCAIFVAKGIPGDRLMLTLAGFAGCGMMYAVPRSLDSRTTMAVFATLMIVLFLLSQIRHSWMHKRTQGAVVIASATMFALIYMGLMPGFLIAIRRWYSAWVVAAILLIVKSCDIGAYFTGRAIGRHKLIPWLSPGKTWEGLVGGVIFSGIVAATLAAISNHFGIAGVFVESGEQLQRVFQPSNFDILRSALAGAVMGLVGQFGDLTASLFKRDAGIKDSGSSVPGFGGILDIVDSPLVVAPLAYWLLAIGAKM